MKLEDLARALSPIWNAIRSGLARAVVRRSNDGPKMQELQIDLGHGDLRDGVERWQNYGVTSRPLDGAEALALAPAGERSLAVVIAVDDRRYRVKLLEEGEVAIYTDEGVAIHLKRGRAVEITGDTIHLEASSSITLRAPAINLDS